MGEIKISRRNLRRLMRWGRRLIIAAAAFWLVLSRPFVPLAPDCRLVATIVRY